MTKTMILKYSGKCRECGAKLQAGTIANYHGKGSGISCVNCLPQTYSNDEPEGLTRSRYDRYGVYTGDGRRIGSTCGCEDYPCCGH